MTRDATTLSWKTGQVLVVDGTTFRLPFGARLAGDVKGGAKAGRGDFLVYKSRPMVEHYIRLIEELQPQHIFELGMYRGGSTALLAALATPRRLVAIDQTQGERRKVAAFAADHGLEDAIRTHSGVDQADRRRLAEIVAADFDDEPLDLVVDDCSHLYTATLASFNELFPRLRPGGVFVIEDWSWAHAPFEPAEDTSVLASPGGSKASSVRSGKPMPPTGTAPLTPTAEKDGWAKYVNQEPLTRLIFELILAIPAIPGLIADVAVELSFMTVRRGDAEVDPDGFDMSACLDERGRALLAPLSLTTEE
jgi:SAM-dependent methyltransferase